MGSWNDLSAAEATRDDDDDDDDDDAVAVAPAAPPRESQQHSRANDDYDDDDDGGDRATTVASTATSHKSSASWDVVSVSELSSRSVSPPTGLGDSSAGDVPSFASVRGNASPVLFTRAF